QHEVEGALAQQLEGLGPAARPRHVEALLAQDRLLEVQDVLVVVHYKDPLGHPHPPAAPGSSGVDSSKVSPGCQQARRAPTRAPRGRTTAFPAAPPSRPGPGPPRSGRARWRPAGPRPPSSTGR